MSPTKRTVRSKKDTANPQPTGQDSSVGMRRERLRAPIVKIVRIIRIFHAGSPHKSFRRTLRRDYVRSLDMPGYIAFTHEVWRTVWKYKAVFGPLVATYALFSGLFVGLASQETYSQLAEVIRSTSGELFQGKIGELGKAGLLLVTGLSGGLNPQITQNQLTLSGVFVLLVWLTTVWLLRAFLAGKHPRMRDGLYNAGSPIVATAIVGLLLIVQLLPAALVPLGISAATATDPELLSGGVEAMLFWSVAFFLILLSLYWITSTFIALVIVTLPGMYPLEAVRTAGSLVVGRRFRLLLRIVWLLVMSLLLFVIVMIPVILFDAWLKGLVPAIAWLPIVPLTLLVCSSALLVWMASYVYLLYRKVVDDDEE